ncbi:uncharacterized protein LOC110975266 [Acanthaster planci]|uniref:Uncharacterized protein LOC110975266 n=1 Tax=Acanthaster planci TaxID=133434 RepID=A0A8B7XR17_ACAPL|nr:uncharacterized protein LOC110975266 [Acanthaster planci]
MNSRQPNARKIRLPKLPKNVSTVPSHRDRAALPRDELYPALSKSIIKVSGSLYKCNPRSSRSNGEFSPRTVHTEPVVLPSIRRKVQAYLTGDLKDKPKRLGQSKSDCISVATGVAFVEQKPVPLVKSEAPYPGTSDLQSFPKRALPQWTSTRVKPKSITNKTGYRLSPLPKNDYGDSLATKPELDNGLANTLDAFNEAKIEEFRWWHEKMRRIGGEDNPRAPPNTALDHEPSKAQNEQHKPAKTSANLNMISSKHRDKIHTAKKQRTVKSTSIGLASDVIHSNTSGLKHAHQRDGSVVENVDLNPTSSANDPSSGRPKFKANLIDVHVPAVLPHSSQSPRKVKQRERITQWLAQCEQAVQLSDNKHWFRLPGVDSDQSRCSTCEREFTHYSGIDTLAGDNTSTRPSYDFTKARLLSRDEKFHSSKPLRR